MRVLALIKRIILQMLRDKRTLALLFFAPLVVLTLMYFFFNGDTEDPELGIVDMEQSFIAALEESDITVIEYTAADEATLIADELDGLLQMTDGNLSLTLENSDPTTARTLLARISQAAALQGNAASPDQRQVEIDTAYVYGDEDTEFFDVLSPILVGFFVFFFVFLISGIGLLKERVSGTLERLLATPIRRWEIEIGRAHV